MDGEIRSNCSFGTDACSGTDDCSRAEFKHEQPLQGLGYENCVNLDQDTSKASSLSSLDNYHATKDLRQERVMQMLPSENADEAVTAITLKSNFDIRLTQDPTIHHLQEYKSQHNDGKVEGERTGRNKFHSPPSSIFSPVVKAIQDFSMIKNNDRLLLCLSGGKDSLSMLHAIHQYKFYAKSQGISFEYGALTVDPKSSTYDPSPLKHYLASLNVPYFYEEQEIIAQASSLSVCGSICSFCSRMKRGRIYACARREGYNVIAIGHHLDDIAESFIMSVFHNGLLRTMKAAYTVAERTKYIDSLNNFATNKQLPNNELIQLTDDRMEWSAMIIDAYTRPNTRPDT